MSRAGRWPRPRCLKVVAQPKLLYLVSEDWYFVSHRLALAAAAKAAGFDVAVATRVSSHAEPIREAGLRLIPITFTRASLRPWSELRSLRELAGVYRREAPDLIHHVSVKPVIFGTLAARGMQPKGIINALMGLGWVFSSDSLKARTLRPFVRSALRRALAGENTLTIVQNSDDATSIISEGLSRPEQVRLIRGSGVDPGKYSIDPPPPGAPVVVLPARLIEAKGVGEFMQAAAILKQEGSTARFVLVGKADAGNKTSIAPEAIARHVAAGDVEHWGWRDDMPAVFKTASIVCLPTFYGEGLPKALLEAAAASRPIVATDVAGCREIVRPGENGWLVPPRNAIALADALREAIAKPELCARYGEAGRRLVERDFSLDAIIRDTIAVYQELIAKAQIDAGQRVSSGAR
jgi:glycosyltransferase involved in cell wall biosynthesis